MIKKKKREREKRRAEKKRLKRVSLEEEKGASEIGLIVTITAIARYDYARLERAELPLRKIRV